MRSGAFDDTCTRIINCCICRYVFNGRIDRYVFGCCIDGCIVGRRIDQYIFGYRIDRHVYDRTCGDRASRYPSDDRIDRGVFRGRSSQ